MPTLSTIAAASNKRAPIWRALQQSSTPLSGSAPPQRFRGSPQRRRVERLDLGREVLFADATLQLQRRCDLALVGTEVARQHREALDLLRATELGVRVVDDT